VSFQTALAIAPTPAPLARFRRTCPECGELFRTDQCARAFCCEAHKKAFNNRRMLRGAVVYDLFMCLRFDRRLATAMHVWKLLCRLTAAFREEDVERRSGRKSWRAPGEVIAERHWLHATVIHSKTWKRPGIS